MFLQFYGLNEQPFGVTPDPRFLYLGPAQKEAFASLIYGIETGRGFMALIAPPGLGKTTMTLRLMEKLRGSALTAFLFQTHSDSKEFLKNLLLDLDAEPTGHDLSDLQAQLHELLLKGLQAGRRLVLVIDEAQGLDEPVLEMVRMLSNFETPQAKLLQIILVGQPALADKLARPGMAQLRQRISIITHFPLLRGDEVEKYIMHRLRVAGYKGGALFAPGAVALIARYSRGVPRVINNLCFHALSLGYAKNRKKIDVAILREVIADLNLESLGQRRAVPVAAAVGQTQGPQATAREPQESTGVRPGSGKPSVDTGSQSRESGSALLDRVDFSNYAPDWTGGSGSNPRYAARSTVYRSRGRNYRAEVLAVLAIVAVAVLAWRAPWLKPSLDFLQQEVWGDTGTTKTPGSSATTYRTDNAVPGQGAHVRDRQKSSSLNNQNGLSRDLNSGNGKLSGESSKRGRSAIPAGSPDAQANATSPADSGAMIAGESSNERPGANSARSPDAQRGANRVADAPASDGDERSGQTHNADTTRSPEIQPSAPSPTGSSNRPAALVYASAGRGWGRETSVDDMGARGELGKLMVQSSVKDAHITINGREDPRWITPHIFSLVAGTYIVSVLKEGYAGWSQRVEVNPGRERSLVAQLSNTENGILTVETDPPGMQVYIDGRPYGASRVVTVLSAGWHICEVIPPAGLKPLVGRFHLDPGEALTKRIQVTTTTSNALSGPVTQAERTRTAP
jgi:type II secretory pathway predicted ATPase ExeA